MRGACVSCIWIFPLLLTSQDLPSLPVSQGPALVYRPSTGNHCSCYRLDDESWDCTRFHRGWCNSCSLDGIIIDNVLEEV